MRRSLGLLFATVLFGCSAGGEGELPDGNGGGGTSG
jgi:hypothetical protein